MLVTFTLNGQHYQALNGGAPVDYGTAASISVECPDQAEVDRVWAALTANGGSEIACGWLRDRWGVPWQIVPEALPRLLAGPDPAISGPRVSGDAKDGHAGYSRLGARGCGVMTRHLAYPDPGTPEQTRPPDSKWPRAPCRPHYAGDQKHDDAGTDRDQGGQREGWCEVCERVHEGARVCVSTACLSTLNAAHHPGVQASARPTDASRRSAGRQSRSAVLCARLSEGRSAGSEPHLQVKRCRYQAYGNGRRPDRGEAAGAVENKAACPGPHERA